MVVPLERLISLILTPKSLKKTLTRSISTSETLFVQKIAVRRVDYHFFSLLEVYVHVVVRRPIQELSNIYVHLAGLTFITKFWKRCIISINAWVVDFPRKPPNCLRCTNDNLKDCNSPIYKTGGSTVAERPSDDSCHWIFRKVTQDHWKYTV